jgi:hypothetical protein
MSDKKLRIRESSVQCPQSQLCSDAAVELGQVFTGRQIAFAEAAVVSGRQEERGSGSYLHRAAPLVLMRVLAALDDDCARQHLPSNRIWNAAKGTGSGTPRRESAGAEQGPGVSAEIACRSGFARVSRARGASAEAERAGEASVGRRVAGSGRARTGVGQQVQVGRAGVADEMPDKFGFANPRNVEPTVGRDFLLTRSLIHPVTSSFFF